MHCSPLYLLPPLLTHRLIYQPPPPQEPNPTRGSRWCSNTCSCSPSQTAAPVSAGHQVTVFNILGQLEVPELGIESGSLWCDGGGGMFASTVPPGCPNMCILPFKFHMAPTGAEPSEFPLLFLFVYIPGGTFW